MGAPLTTSSIQATPDQVGMARPQLPTQSTEVNKNGSKPQSTPLPSTAISGNATRAAVAPMKITKSLRRSDRYGHRLSCQSGF